MVTEDIKKEKRKKGCVFGLDAVDEEDKYQNRNSNT
jgi:hypothetical protein